MDVPQEIIEEVSKLKKPFEYYTYAIWRGVIAVCCCTALLGIAGVLAYLIIDSGVLDSGGTLIALLIPILFAIVAVVYYTLKIWEWSFTDRLNDWKRKNYPISHANYHEEILAISNDFYDKWESLVKSEDKELSWFNEWGKSFIELGYNRIGFDKKELKKIDIPIYYYNYYYTRDDYKTILSEVGIPEDMLDSVINPFPVSEQYFEDLINKFKVIEDVINANSVVQGLRQLSSLKKQLNKLPSVNDKVRYHLVISNGLHNIIFIDKFSTEKDIEDICTPEFLQSLIPSKRLTLIAAHKEFSKEDFEAECLKRKNAVLFKEKLPTIQNKLIYWNSLCTLPYCYFYNYYPNSVTNINFRDRQIREMIFNFKDSTPDKRAMGAPLGKWGTLGPKKYRDAFDNIVNLVSLKITKTIGGSALSQVSFVCIPSSSEIKTKNRLEDFYTQVCLRTGMDNAFQYIHGEGDSVKHMGGGGLTKIQLNKRYFSGKYVVIFDDIVTSGNTMGKMVEALNECGATVLFIVSIAKTLHYINTHPIDYDPDFNSKTIKI